MTEEQFRVGMSYWPRRSGYGWWGSFDRGEVREELAHVALLGCDMVRFCLSWDGVQPELRRVHGAMLRALECALDAAGAAGLRVVVTLFSTSGGGVLQVPWWANHGDPVEDLRSALRLGVPLRVAAPDAPQVLYDGVYHRSQVGDLFSDARVLAAQRYLIHEVVGYFGPHPAVWAWQLGEGFEYVHRPADVAGVRAWLMLMGEEVRARYAGARLMGMTSLRGLMSRSGPRPEDIAAVCEVVGVVADVPEPALAAPQEYGLFVGYLQALVAALGGRPAFVAGVGVPTVQDGRGGWVADRRLGFATRVYLSEPEAQAVLVGGALQQLREQGGAGVWLAAYADHPSVRWEVPPLDRAVRVRTLGVVDAYGQEKPVAEVVRGFAAGLRRDGGALRAASRLVVDGERYWHDPRRMFGELWRAYRLGQ